MKILYNIKGENKEADCELFDAISHNIANAQTNSKPAFVYRSAPISTNGGNYVFTHVLSISAPIHLLPELQHIGISLLQVVESGKSESVRAVFQDFNIASRSEDENFAIFVMAYEDIGVTAFRNAVIKGDIELVRPFLDVFRSMSPSSRAILLHAKSEHFFFAPLCYAIAFGDFDIAKAIIDVTVTLEPILLCAQYAETKHRKISALNPDIDKTEIFDYLDAAVQEKSPRLWQQLVALAKP